MPSFILECKENFTSSYADPEGCCGHLFVFPVIVSYMRSTDVCFFFFALSEQNTKRPFRYSVYYSYSQIPTFDSYF